MVYPESDGKPIADNTKQFRWIMTIEGGLKSLFREHPDVFVAGDLLWYPVEGHPEICTAPDVLVVFGRPEGLPGSYVQFREGGVALQVVFEVLSPNNTAAELIRKFRFYERYGVDEYYVYDPDKGELSGWQREGERLDEIGAMAGWVSPHLKVRFELRSGELQLYRLDDQPVRFIRRARRRARPRAPAGRAGAPAGRAPRRPTPGVGGHAPDRLTSRRTLLAEPVVRVAGYPCPAAIPCAARSSPVDCG